MHEFAEHVAAVNVPKEHEHVPDTTVARGLGCRAAPQRASAVADAAVGGSGGRTAGRGAVIEVRNLNVCIADDKPVENIATGGATRDC